MTKEKDDIKVAFEITAFGGKVQESIKKATKSTNHNFIQKLSRSHK